MQNVPDPSLQFVWFYAALAFHTNKFAVQRETSRRASTAKVFFVARNFAGSGKRSRRISCAIQQFRSLPGFGIITFCDDAGTSFACDLPTYRGSTIYVKNLKDLAVAWLFVADLAIQSAREQGDYEKAMSYVNAFFRSCIPLQLINWVTSQSEMGTNISKPNVSTPIALLKWLLLVEDQGLVVFDGDTAKLRAKAKVCTSRTEYVFPVVRHFHNDLDSNLLGNSIYGATEEDKFGGDIEMVDSMDTMILAADNRMSSNTADGTRKREEMLEDETKSQVKFMRCQFHGNSMRENSLVFGQE
ncbi:hypothetical protein L6164_015576 [Bauhinia variegata]|uniref:Uncharacterized protein n=1 Tax=Bauhinia variegata TaxID=167791 RepID=A0ACB9NPR3_BAUVA|nr:hypothetical protein L6164_015576 [Bauhinia variegata]